MLKIKVIMAAFIGAMLCGGCQPPATDSKMFVHQWLALTYSPLELESWSYADEEQRFETRTNYGRFSALQGYEMALLLEDGKPAWAGTWILPLRYKGKVAALLLAKSYGDDWYDSIMYDLSWVIVDDALAIREETGHYQRWEFIGPSAFPIYLNKEGGPISHISPDGSVAPKNPPSKEGPYSPNIVDIDGDGTDEIFVTQLQYALCNLPWLKKLKWQLVLYEFEYQPASKDSLSLFEDEPEPPFSKETNESDDEEWIPSSFMTKKFPKTSAGLNIVSAFTIPVEHEGRCYGMAEKNPPGKLVIEEWPDMEKGHVLGTIQKGVKGFEWIPNKSPVTQPTTQPVQK